MFIDPYLSCNQTKWLDIKIAADIKCLFDINKLNINFVYLLEKHLLSASAFTLGSVHLFLSLFVFSATFWEAVRILQNLMEFEIKGCAAEGRQKLN